MSRKHQGKHKISPRTQVGKTRNANPVRLVFGILFGLVAVAVVLVNRPRVTGTGAVSEPLTSQPATWEQLVALPPEQIQRIDIVTLNLLCAAGLPGADGLDLGICRKTLDQWSERVRSETDRHLPRFRANPAEYENSEGYFRMLMIAVVFYEDFNIRYNPNRITLPSTSDLNDNFFADSRDVFIHGLVSDRRMGTCSSMPVLYLAVGRRLGYPLKLVTTKAHLFLRWEGGAEKFDLEATGKGMNRYDDAHFKQWPFPVSDVEIASEHYLKSLSPAEELAVFLSLRGNCLKAADNLEAAAHCYQAACHMAPDWNSYRVLLASTKRIPAVSDLTLLKNAEPDSQAVPVIQNSVQISQPTFQPDPNPLRAASTSR